MKIRFKSKCTKCPLHIGAVSKCIGGEGAEDLEGKGILFVGEAPGEVEAGVELRKLANSVVSDRIPIRYTNAVRCFPSDNPVGLGVGPCREYLLEEINRVNPGRIIALGRHAVQSLTGYHLPISEVVEGWARTTMFTNTTVQFAYHPAVQLHNKSLRHFWHKTTSRMIKHPPPESWKGLEGVEIVHVHTIKKALAVLAEAMDQAYVAYDTEYNDKTNRLLCASFCWDVNKAYVFTDVVMGHSLVIAAIERLFQTVRMVAHNWKFDAWTSIRALGIDPAVILRPDGWWVDTSTLRKLHHPEQESNLEIAEWQVGMGGGKEELYQLLGRSHKGPAYEKAYNDYPEVVMRYCGNDGIGCFRLLVRYSQGLKRDGLAPLWSEIFGPLGGLLFHMEHVGLKVDTEALDALDARLKSSLERELIAIRSSKVVKRVAKTWPYDATAEEFNPKSSHHMRELLFLNEEGLRLTPRGTTPGGLPSANKYIVAAYKNDDPVMGHISEFNRLKHKHSTYVEGWRKRLSADNTIHCSIRQDAARTQRVQARDPNLMTIPNRGWEEDLAIRRTCIPHDPDKEVLLEVDFSQVELREAADLSNDANMMEVFLTRQDIHRKTASEIMGIPMEEVDKLQRTKAKPINFGTIFLQTWRGLQENAEKEYGVHLTDEEAKMWRNGFFRTYKGYRAWTLRELALARKRGCAYIYRSGKPFARRWLFHLGEKFDKSRRGHAERQVVNTPIQGGASLKLLHSGVILLAMLQKGDLPGVTRIVLPVHDALIFTVKRNMVKKAFRKIGKVMISEPTIRVPLEVEGKAGPNLADMKVIGVMSALDELQPKKVRIAVV